MLIRWILRIGIALFLLLVVGAAAGVHYAWKKYTPELPVLKDKDAEKYAAMMAYFKGLKFKEGVEIYQLLHTHTKGQMIAMRYREERDKWEGDKKYRIQEWAKELDRRRQLNETKQKEYTDSSNNIEEGQKENYRKTSTAQWQKASPWQKNLILREKCIKYMNREEAKSGKRKNVLDLPSTSAQGALPGKAEGFAEELCAKLVPPGDGVKTVEQALSRLKNEMNYFYFAQLLDELGIPSNNVLSFSERVQRMSAGMADG